MKNAQPLYAPHTLSERFSATKEFITSCWKPLLCALSAIAVPLCAVQTILGRIPEDSISATITKGDMWRFAETMSLNAVITVIADFCIIMTVYGMMRLYHKGDNDTVAISGSASAKQLWQHVKSQWGAACKSLGSMAVLSIVLLVAVVAIGMFAGIMTAAINGNEKYLVAVAMMLGGLMLVAVPFWVLAIPAYSLDGLGFGKGIAQAASYGLRTWWGIVAILTAYAIADAVLTMPFEMLPSPVGPFVSSYISCIIQAVAFITLGYQYAYAKTKA